MLFNISPITVSKGIIKSKNMISSSKTIDELAKTKPYVSIIIKQANRHSIYHNLVSLFIKKFKEIQ